MDFDFYQKECQKTAIYPVIGRGFVYPTLGLLGEAGEVAEKIKKIFRDEKGKIAPNKKEEIKKELGDVLWYLSQISTELKISLNGVAVENLKKLKSRKERKQIHGNGDNR